MTGEEAIKTLKGEAWVCCQEKWLEALDMASRALKKEPKTGHWRRGEKDKHGYYHFHCSECSEEIQTKSKDFCEPYCCMCGAKMESEDRYEQTTEKSSRAD